MPLDVQSAIRDLAKSVRTRKLVPFCGAGVSLNASPPLPGASEFLRQRGLESLPFPQGASVLLSQPRFWLTFQETFGDPEGEERSPSEQHRLLACLDAPFYVTTNYDRLLERALRRVHDTAEDSVGVLNKQRGLSSVFQYRNLVVKLHGDVDSNELLVFSESDYETRLRTPTVVDQFVKLLFATHTILFVGYSLTDMNILAMLRWEIDNVQQVPRKKYLLVEKIDGQDVDRLKRMNVFPVVVGHADRSYEESVCDFLVRLWEQNEEHNAFVRMLDTPPNTTRDRMRAAMIYRQTGQYQKASDCLDQLFAVDGGCFELDLLMDFLWLNVSVRDKCEHWDALETVDGSLIMSLFRRLEKSLPHAVFTSIRAAYRASLAIAFCRAGKFAKAAECASESVHWQCTDTATPGFQIVNGNSLVAAALCYLHLWALKKDPDLLREASKHIGHAWEFFAAHANPGRPDESHHLGRFYGTRAFLAIAMARTNVASIDISSLCADAQAAHEPVACRTRFGEISGLYCEAVAEYWLATRSESDSLQIDRIRLAEKLVERVKRALDPLQSAASMKVAMLAARIEKLGNRAVEHDDVILRNHGPNLSRQLLTTIQKIGCDEWVFLPLN